MARSRRAPSRRSSSFGRSSSPPMRSPPSPTHRPEVTNVYVQRRPGGFGGSGMLGTMAAVAGGSVIGHGISNYLYGHNNQAPTQPAEAQELARTAAQENHVCAPQLVGYSKCLEANPSSADSCKWAWDYFMQCQRASEGQQQQQPPV